MTCHLKPLILSTILFFTISISTNAQKCNCTSGFCCSKYGYCGTTSDYCGKDCKSGPCNPTPPPSNNVSVSDIATHDFFISIISQASDTGCPGKSFYTYDAFLSALRPYPDFGRTGTVNDSKREIAAFFAHVTHETGHFCYIEEINGPSLDYCDKNNTQYPCVAGQGYYGRGPIQLSWNFNYGPAGQSIGFDGLNSPGTVATDVIISFKTALWYWMSYVHDVVREGFGATTKAINGALECNGKNTDKMNKRIKYYEDYCQQFGVDPGNNLSC